MQTAQHDFEQTARFAAAAERRGKPADRPRLRLDQAALDGRGKWTGYTSP